MKNRKIIDFHAHIFPEKVAAKAVESIGHYYGVKMGKAGTVENLLESGKEIGVSNYIVHSTATRVDQVAAINEFIVGAQAENPQFIGFGTLHPGLPDLSAEVERIMAAGLRGIKLHPEFQGFCLDGEEMLPLYAAIAGKLPLLIHMGDENTDSSSPARLFRIMDKFPQLVVIAAHFGGYRMWDLSMKYLVGKEVYFDTSSSLWKLDRETAVDMIHRHGVDKVLFGTDFPMWGHKEEFDRFLALRLTQEEQEKILWKNACKLLKIQQV